MTFDWGYLVVLAGVILILFVYRQLDKNNRSLEKIRQFADAVRKDLNVFVEERTAAVRDMEAVLKVHDKTAAEILRRIQGVESNLLTRTPEIEDLQARLDRYALTMGELQTQTQSVDASLNRLKDEIVFVDRVSQRIKTASDQMQALETDFATIRRDFAEVNQKDLDEVRRAATAVFERETQTYVQTLGDAQARVDALRGLVDSTESTLEARADQVLDAAEARFRDTARQAEDLSSVVFLKLEERVEAQARDSEARLRAEAQEREGALKEAMERLHLLEAGHREALATLRTGAEEAARVLREDFQSEQAQLLGLTAQLKSDLELKLTAVRREVSAEADALRDELRKSLEVDRASAQGLVNEVRELLSGARKDTQQNEQRVLEGLEARLKDYEAGFGYRFSKMEEAERDLAMLDQNLRQAMEKVAERIQNDFAAFDEAMGLKRQDEQAQLERQIQVTQAAIVRLDADLEELKARAYDNVSEKLQGFEEDFFADLQKRSAGMSQSLEEWQERQRADLEDLKAASERERTEMERLMAETARERIQELQTTSLQQIDRLERQILDSQETMAATVRAHADELEETRGRLAGGLDDLETSLVKRFEQDRARAELAVAETLTKTEREIDARIRSLSEKLEEFRSEYQDSLNSAQTDFGLWQTKFDQRYKELESDLAEQYRGYRASLNEKIAALTDEFNLQKEELITRSAEDRFALKSDLAQLRNGIDELESTLRARSQSITESLERDFEAMSADVQKKNRELVVDIENRLRDYRAAVADTKDKAEAQQKKLFGRIDDQAGLLTVSLEEIEKRQKSFVSQTKVFERADTLKQELQEAVEDLKGDLARIEVQRKDLFEIEASIARVKKLGDETSEKVARFNAEKKRIDLMDTDFQRILGLSQSMELRLEQVTGSHDLLQDIQLRIRKLEDYSKDIEVRYERLEKRREVLDNTTDGVDRNFALIEKIEKSVKALDGELKSMPAEVEELRKRIKVLSTGKDDADRAVERLGQLDQTLKDVEARIGRMEQAREWIAGVETRLTETKTAAEEQVATLKTITRDTGGPLPKSKAADTDLRQTVLKLARQGWGKEEISRATKLSLGEVELILELGAR